MTKKFYRNIIFSKTPLKSYYRFKDEFQIFPCDIEAAPKSRYCFDFPLIIEYWVDEDEKIEVPEDFEDLKEHISKGTVQINKLNALTRILSSITNHRFFSYNDTEFKWGISIPDKALTKEEKEIINSQSSQSFLGLYTYPNMWKDLQIKEFSAQRHPSSEFSQHFLYYMNDPIDDKTKDIKFPITIYQTLKKYFSLDAKKKSY